MPERLWRPRIRGVRVYLINGEPTENKIALDRKARSVMKLCRMAGWRIPRIRSWASPQSKHCSMCCSAFVQSTCPRTNCLDRSTLNIGTIAGGRAPNVIPDFAKAEIMFRLVGDAAPLREAVNKAVAGRADAREVFTTPAQRLESFPGLPTAVVSFSTDIPSFGGAWGKPFLIGPGSIHVAHTAEEQSPNRQLLEAVNDLRAYDKYADFSGRHLNAGGLFAVCRQIIRAC